MSVMDAEFSLGPSRRFDDQILGFTDPDGLMLELVASARVADVTPWPDGPVPPEHAVRGLHGATIWEDGDTGSADFLGRNLGFSVVTEQENILRLTSAQTGVGTVIDLRRVPGFWRGAGGVGTVHHIAFRAASGEAQRRMRTEIVAQGVSATPVIDRQYFQSVYFREPGGVLYEIATDDPGFAVDELVSELGTHLKLPPMYEPNRQQIERVLPPLRLPHAAAGEGR